MTEGRVLSKDGTPIAYWCGGEGPPLLLLHGTAADHVRWAPVLPAFERRFTVYAVDRRGRGGSGDSEGYALEREVEDVVALVESLGEPVNLLGHSYGALCALEAAALTHKLRLLMLYEPPFEPTGKEVNPPELIERLEVLLRAGDREEVVATMASEIAGQPPEVVAYMRTQPSWQARVDAAHTIPRELRVPNTYRFDPERFRGLAVPTLLLSGTESPPFFQVGAEALNQVLPNSRIVVMPGQGHGAMDTGTDLFTAEVLRFAESPS